MSIPILHDYNNDENWKKKYILAMTTVYNLLSYSYINVELMALIKKNVPIYIDRWYICICSYVVTSYSGLPVLFNVC